MRIAPGSSISVSVFDHRGRRECELFTITASELSCDLRRGMSSKRLVFLRDHISEIRLEHPQQHRMILGGIMGGAAGVAIGGLLAGRSGDPEAQRAAPAVGALLGLSLGAGVGRAIHRHGPVLYRR